LDDAADLLKSRGCKAVCYFHTDHFEPWSNTIDETSAKAVERMAAQARLSPYARKISLFYSVFVPYRLASDGPLQSGDMHVPEDQVAFLARSNRQEDLAREVIRPLVTRDGHEMHLHVHHEYWTRNNSHFDTPVSKWVNDCSTAEADRRRLDLHFRLCKEAISREIGKPFDRWAFIHGNWALNASDPLICQVNDELAMIMRHGGFGDFSFPAGRSYCDPKIKSPFTCLPIDLARAYDDPQADPRPLGPGSRSLLPGRFFIWNAPIRSLDCSLDYYSAPNRKLLSMTERVVATWLLKSVCLGDKIFIKTHAHSMSAMYRLSEPDSVIPHCYPDAVRAFDYLARVCERAGVELRFQTVNEAVRLLADLDEGQNPLEGSLLIDMPKRTEAKATPIVAEEPLPTSPADAAEEVLSLHRDWVQTGGARFPTDELYAAKLARGAPLELYELALAQAIAERFPPGATRLIEIGTAWGGLSITLARLGYEVLGFEGNAARHAACQWHIAEQIRQYPALQGRLRLAPEGLFPDTFAKSDLPADKLNICIATNITSSYSAEHERQIFEAAAACDEFIVDLARFGSVRDCQSERNDLLRVLTASAFKPVERLYFDEPYEYWHLRSRAIAKRRRFPQPSPAVVPSTRSNTLPLSGRHGQLYSVFGDKRLPQCPICHSRNTAPLWSMPMASLAEPLKVFGGYFNQIPTLQVPGTVFCFDFCCNCESIFLNPVPSEQKQNYRTSDHYIRKMRNALEWKEYEDVYDGIARWIPPDTTVMIDAACGIGQYLQVARKRRTHHWKRLIGLELAEKYVAHMRIEGLEAYAFDIDNDDLRAIVPQGSVDFIVFSEAFEHVDRPLDALRKLLDALRPGGRLYCSAQRYGRDVQAAVRPGEPIYIGETVLEEMPKWLGCRIVSKMTSGTRYYLVLEK
jgi:2-polyprenyl-3-methyl-5-hydroxy-6-metoxy-1,4-benzoquinol methylase